MNTTYFLNLVMDSVFHTGDDATLPTNYYIGLTTSEPSVDGIISGEPDTGTGTGYQRQLLNLVRNNDGVVENKDAIEFSESASNWGTMKYYIVCDAPKEEAENGNLLFYGALEEARTIESGTTFTIKAGGMKITLKDAVTDSTATA